MLQLVHPAIIDLYIAFLKQYSLENTIDNYGEPDCWPDNTPDIIMNMAYEINEKHEKALIALGSEAMITQQLDHFGAMGGTA